MVSEDLNETKIDQLMVSLNQSLSRCKNEVVFDFFVVSTVMSSGSGKVFEGTYGSKFSNC